MATPAGVKKDGYKDYPLPSEQENLFLLENNKKAIEGFRSQMNKYIQTLAADLEMANTDLMKVFLTCTDKETLKETLQRIKKKNNLPDICAKLERFDIEDIYIDYTEYFEDEEVPELELSKQDMYRARGILDYEKQMNNIVAHLEQRCKLNDEISLVVQSISTDLEKFRINSETPQLDKLFLLGGFIDFGDVEDIDNIGLSKVNIDEGSPNDNMGTEHVSIEQLKKNKKYTLRENAG